MSAKTALMIATFVLASAHAQAATACPTAHELPAMPGMTRGCNCNTAIERLQPAGTRVYSYDQYVVLDGHRNVHFSIHAKLWCDTNALHVYDPHTGAKDTFSLQARIVRLKDGSEVFVHPGHAMPSQLKRDISDGIAHFKMIVKSRSV